MRARAPESRTFNGGEKVPGQVHTRPAVERGGTEPVQTPRARGNGSDNGSTEPGNSDPGRVRASD